MFKINKMMYNYFFSGTLPSLWIWFRRLSDDNRWWPLGRIQSRISTTTIFIGNKTLFNIKLQYNVIFKHHYNMQKCNHTIYTFIHSTCNIRITNNLFRNKFYIFILLFDCMKTFSYHITSHSTSEYIFIYKNCSIWEEIKDL